MFYWFDSDVPLGCDTSPEFFFQTKRSQDSPISHSLSNKTLDSLFAELEVQWFPLGVEVAEEVVDIDDLRLQGFKYFWLRAQEVTFCVCLSVRHKFVKSSQS